MSATTSASSGRRYGIHRVCRVWERTRSVLYARRARARRREQGEPPARRGPQPARSDQTTAAGGIVNLLRAARSCPVKSTLPTVFSRRTSPHPIQRTRGCGAGGGEPTAGGVD